jgi:hypothetical protein
MITKEQFRRLKIVNSWDYNQGQIFITYRAKSDWFSAAWAVHHPGHNLSAQWSDYGAKTFYVGSKKDKIVELENAKKYVAQKFGITDLVKSPFGDWVSKSFVDKRNAECKNALKLLDNNPC